MAYKLRDGAETQDPRLDRLVQFDERSRDFPISAVIPPTITRGRSWYVQPRLDQGQEGACVGFGVSHELAGWPAPVRGIDDAFAQEIYREAQKIDPWPGEEYSGTSVLAGVKIAQQRGYFGTYRWCFSVEDILRALAHEGPVVVGTVWKDGMYQPDSSGLIRPGGGEVVGGHCYLIRGFALDPSRGNWPVSLKEPTFRIRNSWGGDWGRAGDAFITVADYERYLMPDSDAAVFVDRHRVAKPSVVTTGSHRRSARGQSR